MQPPVKYEEETKLGLEKHKGEKETKNGQKLYLVLRILRRKQLVCSGICEKLQRKKKKKCRRIKVSVKNYKPRIVLCMFHSEILSP